MPTITAAELKYQHTERHPRSHFFDRKTLAFFGDTMRNYGARAVTVQTAEGPREAWELYRRRPVRHGLQRSAYFDRVTFAQLHGVTE